MVVEIYKHVPETKFNNYIQKSSANDGITSLLTGERSVILKTMLIWGLNWQSDNRVIRKLKSLQANWSIRFVMRATQKLLSTPKAQKPQYQTTKGMETFGIQGSNIGPDGFVPGDLSEPLRSTRGARCARSDRTGVYRYLLSVDVAGKSSADPACCSSPAGGTTARLVQASASRSKKTSAVWVELAIAISQQNTYRASWKWPYIYITFCEMRTSP